MASTVLIVEDDPTTTDFVQRYLRRDGHRVLTAADGVEGLRIARERKPDLVVLDLMLPKPDGIAVQVAGLVVRRQHPQAKTYFLTLEDEFGHTPALAWPDTWMSARPG